MSEQVLDVREALRLVRQQRWMVAACVLIGALVPAAVIFWRPPSYSAVALVLVPDTGASSSQSSSTSANVTDSEIAGSSTILGRLGVTPPISLQTAKQRVAVEPVATNLVQITATGTTPSTAEQLANHVANHLVTFLSSTGDAEESSAISELQLEARQLTRQATAQDKEINDAQFFRNLNGPSSAAGLQETQLLGSLTTAESNTELQLQSVNSQIQASKLGLATANGGTEVIQYASTASPTSLIKKAIPVLAGAVVGFLVGSAVAIHRRKRHKVVLRDDFARVVGARVILSLSVGRWATTPSTSKWLALLRKSNPSAIELRSIIRALGQLERYDNGHPTITVITLANDTASVALVTRVAIASGSMGIPTSLVLTSEEHATLGLSNAYEHLIAGNESGLENLQLVKDSAPAEGNDESLTIISMVLDPDTPKLPAYVARGLVILCVTAGFVNLEQLNLVLLAIGQEGQTVNGVFVTNPVSSDHTTGVWTDSVDRGSQLLRRTRLDLLPDAEASGIEVI